MHIKLLLILLLFLSNASALIAGVYETQGHNTEIYEKDIKTLKKILKQNPWDLTTLERLVKLCFAVEKFDEAVEYSGKYLKKKRNKEILFLKLISLANQSDYASAVKDIGILLNEYELSSSEKKLLTEKMDIYKKGLASKAYPSTLKPASWGKGKIVIGMLYRKSLLAGFDYINKKSFFYDTGSGAFIDNFNDEIFSGLNFRSLLFFSVSPDEREILASVSADKDSVSIFYRYFSAGNNEWSSWERISQLNEGSVNNYANFMPDGRHVIFVSNRDPANGLDIYKTGKNTGGQWQMPVRIKGINTVLDESSVIIHPDNETVYFSSNGRGGSGGYDLYGAKIQKGQHGFVFSNIENIREINTFRNEIRPPLISMDLKGIFFNFLKTGRNSIYQGNIEYKPNAASFVDIYVFDKLTKGPVKTEVKLIENSAGRTTYKNITDKNGYTGFMLQRKKKYFVSLFSEGYIYETGELEIPGDLLFFKKEYYLAKGQIKKGYSFTADNIYFDTGSSVIREESYPDLERVFDFMVKNPGVKVNISGNTDNVGTYEYNMRLSRERANSIVEYLTQKGIDRNRMAAQGFGFLRSVAPNTTDTGRQKNRRVEINVISSD